jgi:class III poly(R)-hydroxyalkanoic acid synthase PhaE subunit
MKDYFKQQAEWLKTWQESQEKLTREYVEACEEWKGTLFGNKVKEPDFFEGWFRSQNELEEQFREFSKRLNEMVTTLWAGTVPPEVLKFMNISFFEEFYKHWLSTLEWPGGMKNPLGIDGGWQQAIRFLRSFLENNHPFFTSFSNANIAHQMSSIFGMLQGALGAGGSVFGNFASGYQDMFSNVFESTTAQGTEKLAEAFEKWAQEVEKHLMAPKVGINRELVQDITQALVMSQKYIQAYLNMTRLVEATSRKAGIRFQTKLSEAALSNKPVNRFSDFCALWAVENEAVFLEIMGSQKYAKLQGEFVDAGHRLRIQLNKLGEKALEQTPIALKRDLDLAIAEIHQLKRDMKAFRRELGDKERDLREAREAQVAAEKEAQKARAAVKAAETAAKAEVKEAREAVKAAKAAATAGLKAAEAAGQETAKKAEMAKTVVEKREGMVKADPKTPKAATAVTTKTKTKRN